MLCPNCQAELKMSERTGVEIDYCPECRGVWLDRGELDKIIERSIAPVQATQSEAKRKRDFDDDDDDDRYRDNRSYEKKKRKSFIEDLFDF